MKHFFIFLLWIPFVSSAQIRVDAKGDKLNGNVKKMVEYEYSFLGHRNRNRVPFPIAIYTYDEEMKQENVYHYQGDSTRYIFRDIFKFDKDKLIECHHIQKTNTHGNYLENDSTCYLIAYQYNDNGRLSEEVSTSLDRHSSQHYTKTDYLYDKQGNVIEKDVYYHLNALDDRFDTVKNIFKYDSGGHIIQKDYHRDQVTDQTIYKYSGNYHYSEEHTIDTIPDRERKTIRRYNDRMNLIEERSYCRCDDTHTKNKYKYDDKGNWVERTEYLHGKKYSNIKRVITY